MVVGRQVAGGDADLPQAALDAPRPAVQNNQRSIETGTVARVGWVKTDNPLYFNGLSVTEESAGMQLFFNGVK